MRERKYSPKALEAACEQWLMGISAIEPVMKNVDTGELDKYGHPVFSQEPAVNSFGEPILHRVFYVSPTFPDLFLKLGISKSSWNRYANDERYANICAWVKMEIEAWMQQELQTREGKNTRGIEFSLNNNFGWKDEKRVELGETAAKAVAAAPALSMAERLALLQEVAGTFGEAQDGEEAEDQ